MRARFLLAAVSMLFASAAFADTCPAMIKKIDDAIATSPKLTDAQMAEVKKYRAEADTMHKAGKHKESAAAYTKALAMLNIKP